MKGRVIKSTGSWYTVKTDEGVIQARLKGKFKQEELKLTNPIAVGDWVGMDLEPGLDTAMIRTIIPRENYVIRKSTRKQHHSHIIASNLDQALLLITMEQPRTSQGFIDRFLVSAESFRIPAILIVNKWDRYGETNKGKEWLRKLKETYEPLGYPVVTVSALEDEGIREKMSPFLHGKSTLIAGHSGVGKSTFLNRLIPNATQFTQDISKFSSKGVHTTTFAELFELEGGGDLIDTPGIKEFGILDIGEEELSHYFPEMRAQLGQCKFHNCRHINEPGCRILELVDAGTIKTSRYSSYLNILQEEDSHR